MGSWNEEFEEALAYIERHGYSLDPTDDPEFVDDKSSVNTVQHCHYNAEINSRLPTVIPSDINESDEEEKVSSYDNNARRSMKNHYHQRSRGTHGHLRLWEFILSLLNNPDYNSTHIVWTDRQNGVFKIIRNLEIARLWGEMKNNKRMTYQNMSRAMRYYYKFKIMEPVLGRRLVYKFGSNAFGWK